MSKLIKQEDICNAAAWNKDPILQKKFQKKITETSILVVGSDILAQKILGCLVGLGYGKIFLMDNKRISREDSKYFLYFKEGRNKEGKKITYWPKESKVKHIADTLKAIRTEDDEIKINPRHTCFVKGIVTSGIKPKNPNENFLLINASNDHFSKEECIFYSKKYNLPFISVSSDYFKARLTCYYNAKRNKLMHDLEPNLETLVHEDFIGKEQGAFTSSIIAGLVAEETRKYTFNINNILDKPLRNNIPLNYDSGLNKKVENLKDKKVLIVGAGGIGTWTALDLMLEGVGEIDIVDQDSVKNKNLNRQILYYNALGKRKAEILSKRLNVIKEDIVCKGIYGRVSASRTQNMDRDLEIITEKKIKSQKYDALFGCVDNREARIFLDKVSQKYDIPYIDGAVSSFRCKVRNYIPGFNKPIGQQTDLTKLMPEINGSGCIEVINPSIINPNMIAGGVMVNRFLSLCNNQPNRKIFKYESLLNNRFEEF